MFGRQIVSSRDCIQLSDEIFRITKARLNANTLRRFFGLVKTSYSPSSSTIQILCSYCGFRSIDEVQSHHGEIITRELDSPEQKSLVHYLVSLFRETPVDNEKNETFKSIVKQTIVFLNQQHRLVDYFQLMVAKTKNGQDYYFEGFVNIDRLNSNYGNGLRYYLNEKNDPDAQIFGYSLLVFRYWLTENEPETEQNFQKLTNIPSDEPLSYQASGRYFASLLYHDHTTGSSSSGSIMKINEYNTKLEEAELAAQIDFEVVVAEALVLTGNYDEGLFYCSMALKKTQSVHRIEESVLQNLYLLQALAMYKTGDEKNTGQNYRRIRPTDFSFLNKKMLTILYSFLTKKLSKNENYYSVDRSGELIAETGFSRLEKLFSLEDQLKETVD